MVADPALAALFVIVNLIPMPGSISEFANSRLVKSVSTESMRLLTQSYVSVFTVTVQSGYVPFGIPTALIENVVSVGEGLVLTS